MNRIKQRFLQLLQDYISISAAAISFGLIVAIIFSGGIIQFTVGFLSLAAWTLVCWSYFIVCIPLRTLYRSARNRSSATVAIRRFADWDSAAVVGGKQESPTREAAASRKTRSIVENDLASASIAVSSTADVVFGRVIVTDPTPAGELPMNQLKVENGVLRFLGKTIFISHITSYQVVYLKRKPPKLYPRLILILVAIGLVAGALAWLLFSGALGPLLDPSSFEFVSQVLVLVTVMVGGALFLLIGNRMRVFFWNLFAPRAGLHLRLTGGDGQLIVSRDRQMLLDIGDAVEQAMNNPKTVITNNFQGADVHFEDVENVVFGNQVK